MIAFGVKFKEGEKVIQRNGQKTVYRCDDCGLPFTWDHESEWFGSDKDLDNGNYSKIVFVCSQICRWNQDQRKVKG